MMIKILRTVIGLPVSVCAWLLAILMETLIVIGCVVVEWAQYGEFRTHFYTHLPPSPYQFLKQIWNNGGSNQSE